MKRLAYEFIEKCFEDQGCHIVEEAYTGDNFRIKYICVCGRISTTSFWDFQKGVRCVKCGTEKAAKKRRLKFEYVEQFFEDHGCKLLETEYKGDRVKLKYRCECGKIDKIKFSHFKRGVRCKECGIKKNTGKNSSRWIEDREEFKENKKFRSRCRSMLRYVLKQINQPKTDRTHIMLGYSVSELRDHICNHPNWDIVKNKEHHIDHIYPIKAFLDYNIKDVKLINSFDNLQPLSERENLVKSYNYNKKEFENWLKKKKVKF